jgi:hypothetical protein
VKAMSTTVDYPQLYLMGIRLDDFTIGKVNTTVDIQNSMTVKVEVEGMTDNALVLTKIFDGYDMKKCTDIVIMLSNHTLYQLSNCLIVGIEQKTRSETLNYYDIRLTLVARENWKLMSKAKKDPFIFR